MGVTLNQGLPAGATPLTDDDMRGLLISTVFDRAALNRAEAENIAKAKTYFLGHRRKYRDLGYLLSDECIKDVHKRMFGDVWEWAGKYRVHDTNIGDAWALVPVKTRDLLLNYKERCKHTNGSDQEIDRLAVSLHFDLVSIHPFPNGNGRHARQIADLLLAAYDKPVFPWKNADLVQDGTVRQEYIAAIRHAASYETKNDIEPLLAVAWGL